jgi:chromosome segregation ATPase
LTSERTELRQDVRALRGEVDRSDTRGDELAEKLSAAETRLAQLSTDASGKDAVIKQLQDDGAAKQARIDALTAERTALEGCLDGVTLALVQLTNDGSGAARSTIDGVREQCRQAEVLL